jgi:alpha-soluble NSF attachment protein
MSGRGDEFFENAEKKLTSFSPPNKNGKHTDTAGLSTKAGKMFQESGDLDAAIEAYQDAAQLYDDENQPLQAVNQIAIIADIKAAQQKWLEAACVYREVAERRMRDRLTQMAAGEFFTKAVLCQMAADDAIGAENMLREFVTTNPGWERSREHAMLADVLKAIDEGDRESFTTAVAEYDQIKRLDRWMTDVLLLVKGSVEFETDTLL